MSTRRLAGIVSARLPMAVAMAAIFACALTGNAAKVPPGGGKPLEFEPPMPKVTVPTVFYYTKHNWHREAAPKCRCLTFRAWLANPLATPLQNVKATLSSPSASIKVVQGTLQFDFVRPHSSTLSTGTFTIEYDSPKKLNFNDLMWTIGLPLAGQPKDPVTKAIVDLPPVGVDSTQIQGQVILTRLDLRLKPGATVQQVNAALAKVGGQIVSMSAGDLSVTVAVPKQASPSALRQLADTLKAQPGIGSARPSFQPAALTFTADGSLTTDAAALTSFRFLMPARFPAAINIATSRAGKSPILDPDGTCKATPVDILLPDLFGAKIPSFIDGLVPFEPPQTPGGVFPADGTISAVHGYLTGAVIGAANPFWSCLNIVPIQAYGLSTDQGTAAVAAEMAHHSRFIVSRSMGFADCNPNPCVAPDGSVETATDRAEDALTWKSKTRPRWDDFLMVNAAGNSLDGDGASIYPGVGVAEFESEAAIAETSDPSFDFVSNSNLWNPQVPDDADGDPFLSLVADAGDEAKLAGEISAAGMSGTDSVENNVLIIGSSHNEPRSAIFTSYVPPDQLLSSSFSNSDPDALAVGEGIFDPNQPPDPNNPLTTGFEGSSFAAPQVAALASYLWILSDDLHHHQPIERTRNAILQNLRGTGIDAYAAALSLDQAVTPSSATAPIRQALLDVDGDGIFTEKDINIFLHFLFFVDGQGNVTTDLPTNTNADYSRYDLNGDGFTTASAAHRERFDLDPSNSTQYGGAFYSTVTEEIEGQPVGFDENALTDAEILCYYAYSPLYAGDTAARKSLLGGRCSFSITPTTANMHPGDTQLFTASGDATFTAAGGAIVSQSSTTALYTAGNTGGTFSVQAANSLHSASATVTIQPIGSLLSGTFTYSRHFTDTVDGVNPLETVDEDGSALVTVAVATDGSLSVTKVAGGVTYQNFVYSECWTDGVKSPFNYVQETFSLTLDSGRILTNTAPKIDIVLTGFGTETDNVQPQDDSCTTSPVTSDLVEGQATFVYIGTPVSTNGKLTEIDFISTDGDGSGTLTLVQ